MPEQVPAEVLEQDGPIQDNADELSNAAGQVPGEDDPQANANKPDDEKKRTGGWLRKLTKAEQERDFWRDEALRTRGDKPAQAKPVEAEEDKPPVKPIRPKSNDFKTWEEYEAAAEKYDDARDEYHEKSTEYKLRQAETGRQQKSQEQEVANGWAAQVAEAEQKYPDFKEVAFNKDIPMSNAVMHAIVRSKVGTEIAYYLGQNPDEAERISRLEPVDALVEIGEIKSRIAKQPAAEEEDKEIEPPAATSKAPRPPVPVKRTSSSPTELDDKLPYKEWERRRNAQLKARQS